MDCAVGRSVSAGFQCIEATWPDLLSLPFTCRPPECSVEFATAIADCQRHDPSTRPNFLELVNRFSLAGQQSQCSTLASIATNG